MTRLVRVRSMSTDFERMRLACLCLALLLGACFDGDFAQGLPCSVDADCGPAFACIEGVCGGPGDRALCGNGLRDQGEACDDGNTNEGDACTPTCHVPVCGDGFEAPDEQCDDGNTSNGDGCSENCDFCGDGIEQPWEQCDDGNTAEGDDCTPACVLPVCGDGFEAPGEVCDDGDEIDSVDCTTACTASPQTPTLELNLAQVKQFELSWPPSLGAEHYQLLELVDDHFEPVGGDILGESLSLTMPLHLPTSASYKLRACKNVDACAESDVVERQDPLAEAVGYFKASNTDVGDDFGRIVAISGDGNTLAVAATNEASGAPGIDNDYQTDNSAPHAGAVYIFVRSGTTWSQQAYVKPFNTETGDEFGNALALSDDGDTLAVSAVLESSILTGVSTPVVGDPDIDGAFRSGAVYVFARDDGESWSQQAYVKPSNTGEERRFGWSLSLSGDGDTLAVIGGNSFATEGPEIAAPGDVFVFERDDEQLWSQQQRISNVWVSYQHTRQGSVTLSGDGNTLAIGMPWDDGNGGGSYGGRGAVDVWVRPDQGSSWSQKWKIPSPVAYHAKFGVCVALSGNGDTLAVGHREEASAAGAVQVFLLDEDGWSAHATLQASNPGLNDQFSWTLALSDDGSTLAVGALYEKSAATGIDGDQNDDSHEYAGAVYVFVREDDLWSQQTYVKAPHPGVEFFSAVALSDDGRTLAVGANGEDHLATGVGAVPNDVAAAFNSGAVYLY
jgi:cysteine-rich repeat protein